MNSIRFHAVLLLAMLALVLPVTSHGQSADLKVLQIQYENLLSEKVTDVYNAALAKLDASYLAGVERGLTDAKAAGDLPGVLSLQEEVSRLSSKGALPANDDQAAPALKKLRAIYRTELAKLETQRTANRTALITPYVAKLKQMEADLTKADRVVEAKAVMDYRQAFIATGGAMKTSGTSAPSATNKPPKEIPKDESAAIAAFAKSLGGTKWIWPDPNMEKGQAWFRLNADGTVTAGWHSRARSWKALSDTTIEMNVAITGSDEVQFDSSLTTGTSLRGAKGKIPNAIYKRIND